MSKIIFTVTNDLNYDQRMIRICSALQDAGFECVLVGRNKKNSKTISRQKYVQKRLNCFAEKGKLFYIEFNIRLFFYLLFTASDAICSIDLDTVLPGIWAAKLKRKKHIFDAHELFTHVPEVQRRPGIQKIWNRVQIYAFRHTGLAYTVGEKLAEWFENVYQRKVSTIRNVPVQIPMISYQPDPDKFILYQGALNEGRGLEALILAMKEIPCKLKLAGEGDLSQKLREMVQAENLQEKVSFLGFIAPADLPALTAKAWIGMNVSENAGLSYFLSLNNKFFDYIQAGLPSLINAFPEYVELNQQYHVGVITESVVSDIVANANQLLQNEELHAELSRNCLQAAQELNWEKESKKLVALYHSYFGQA